MSIWNFFNPSRNGEVKSDEINNQDNQSANDDKIIDRNLFIKDVNNTARPENQSNSSWKRIFERIRKDYELEGYNDALSTADNKYKNENLEILKLDLQADIQEAEIDVKEYLKEIEFHINSRKKAELDDLVEELESKKEICLERLKTMVEMKLDIINESGTPFRMILAYKRGFNKGLAALTVATIINRNI
jgi:hypothetical protein